MAAWRDWPNPLIAHVFFNRTRRGAGCAPIAISRLAGAPVAFPYLERELFDFLVGSTRPSSRGRVSTLTRRSPDAIPSTPTFPTAKAKGTHRLPPVGQERLAYLPSAPHIEGLSLDAGARFIGIARILLGGDFNAESWRFQDYDLVQAISRTYSTRS
ncbi:MAG: hypothetical protein U1E87_08775 [Alphaproteobacteria bacterium]